MSKILTNQLQLALLTGWIKNLRTWILRPNGRLHLVITYTKYIV